MQWLGDERVFLFGYFINLLGNWYGEFFIIIDDRKGTICQQDNFQEFLGVLMNESHYSFAALSGIQGRQATYLIQVPLKVLSKLIKAEDTDIPVDQRSQRILNRTRVAQIAKYITDNPNSYILPPLVGYIKYGDVKFEKLENTSNLGTLKIGINADIYLSDGQHRRAAVETAIREREFLGEETIGLLVYAGANIESAQQVFADININATKPAQSIKLLYNHRDQFTAITRTIIDSLPLFSEYVDYERTNLPLKSPKFFTFSGIYQAVKLMIKDQDAGISPAIVQTFWEEVCMNMVEWQKLELKQISPVELREDYVHAHSVVWLALADVGSYLVNTYPTEWRAYVGRLGSLDWSRNNSDWEGRCVVSGRISKSRSHIVLTANQIMKAIGLDLPKQYQEIEDSFCKD